MSASEVSSIICFSIWLSREQRKTILERCNIGCQTVVKGRVDTVSMQAGLIADDVSIH